MTEQLPTGIDFALCEVQFGGRVSDSADEVELAELGWAENDVLHPDRMFLTAAGRSRFRSMDRQQRVTAGRHLRGEGLSALDADQKLGPS